MNSRSSFIALLLNLRNGKDDTSDLIAPDSKEWIILFQWILTKDHLARKKPDHKFGNTEQNFSPLNLSKGSQTPIWAIERRKPFFATRWNASEFLTEGSYGVEHKITKVMKEVYCDLKIYINGLCGMDFIRQSPKGFSEYGNPSL